VRAREFDGRRKVDEICRRIDALRNVKVPGTWHAPSDGALSFIEHPPTRDLHDRKHLEIEEVPYLVPPADLAAEVVSTP